MIESIALSSSFRDPGGFVFEREGILYRQVNKGFSKDIDLLLRSGLHDELVSRGLVVNFAKASSDLAANSLSEMVLQPERVDTISYPHEWCFSQLKDAALLTLEIMSLAIGKEMILKDASAYNIQFVGSRPVFIDTLSFVGYEEGKPWIAYKQFCQHFLAPLALMAKVDIRLSSLLQSNLDGIPLDLALKLLPLKSKLSPGLFAHLHLHAIAQSRSGQMRRAEKVPTVTKTGILALVDSLCSTIEKLTWRATGTEWGDYYLSTNYSAESFVNKGLLVESYLDMLPPTVRTCCDLGANNGEFSQFAVNKGHKVIALDVDPAAVEKCYIRTKSSPVRTLLPLLQDLRNPTPNYGWAGEERDSMVDRFSCGVVLALALVHHLAIGNNVPLPKIADYFSKIGEWLIVEFVPKEDSQIQRMLVARQDIFLNYHVEGFELAFGNRFKIVEKQAVVGTSRIVYLMRRNA